jgi:hypothetical protein
VSKNILLDQQLRKLYKNLSVSCYALEWSGSLSCPLSLLLMYALCFSLQLFIIADEDFIMVCVAYVLCTVHMLQWTKEALDIAKACTELQ